MIRIGSWGNARIGASGVGSKVGAACELASSMATDVEAFIKSKTIKPVNLEARFFAECFIVAIRFFKHEVAVWLDYLRGLKRELRTWKADPRIREAGRTERCSLQ
jgi:hypothetical protein